MQTDREPDIIHVKKFELPSPDIIRKSCEAAVKGILWGIVDVVGWVCSTIFLVRWFCQWMGWW